MYEGKTQLTRMYVYKAEYAQKMKENFAVYTKWMQEKHYREGDKALFFSRMDLYFPCIWMSERRVSKEFKGEKTR